MYGENHLVAYDPELGRSREFTANELHAARGRTREQTMAPFIDEKDRADLAKIADGDERVLLDADGNLTPDVAVLLARVLSRVIAAMEAGEFC